MPPPPLTGSARRVVDTIVGHYRSAPGLSWLHGQGSVFSGFTDRSDLDLVAVWDTIDANLQALPAGMGSRRTPYGSVRLEQTSTDGYDVDVLHVPRHQFEAWVADLDAGQGWQGTDWPLPIYAAAGLAHGVVVLDPLGEGARLQSRLRRPPPSLVASVEAHLAAMLPSCLAELERCTERGDHWLHQHLSVQLIKVVYTAWFLAEGHLPPFPKRLPAWSARLQLDPAVVAREGACWDAATMTTSTEAIAAFAELVLDRIRTAVSTPSDAAVDSASCPQTSEP